uniref:Uncharacterized protein n=1 Tax=Avena sativa TaxID=4498 RepID=A0ACD6AA42_AVESA
MEKLLSAAPAHTSVPDRFVLPPELRPSPRASSGSASLPVIDLGRRRDEVRRAIVNACRDLGFFQVVNHGVSEQAIRDMEAVCEEFFKLPAADKMAYYSEDTCMPNRVFSGDMFGDKGYWRDCLRLACSIPVGDTSKAWPEKPQRLREVAEKFAVQTRGVGMELLRLLCEGMELRPDYFEGAITGGGLAIKVNHYPPSPDPSLTLGIKPHRDKNLIALLLAGSVPGLEVAYKGEWIGVEPVAPDALSVNFGRLLEVVTNGRLKSVEHRVVNHPALARTSVAVFIMPVSGSLISPAEEFVGDDDDDPSRYRPAIYSEFTR